MEGEHKTPWKRWQWESFQAGCHLTPTDSYTCDSFAGYKYADEVSKVGQGWSMWRTRPATGQSSSTMTVTSHYRPPPLPPSPWGKGNYITVYPLSGHQRWVRLCYNASPLCFCPPLCVWQMKCIAIQGGKPKGRGRIPQWQQVHQDS